MPPVDSERKVYGERLTSSAMGWLATQSMRAYGWWVNWLHESDPHLQDWLKEQTPAPCRDLIRRAYEKSRRELKRRR